MRLLRVASQGAAVILDSFEYVQNVYLFARRQRFSLIPSGLNCWILVTMGKITRFQQIRNAR
mgnify:CR=1 FL=1